MREIILHIGTAKTGTTTIQEFSSVNRNILNEMKILYPKAMGNKNYNHNRLAMCAAAPKRRIHLKISDDQNLLTSFRLSTLSDWNRELQATTAERIIFSSEHLHSQLRSLEEVKALKDILPAVPCRVIMYLRRQDKAAVSRTSTAIKAGFENENSFPKLNNKKLSRYDYLSSYKLWSEVFGPGSVSIRPFNREEFKGGDLLKDICSIIGIEWDDKFIVPENRNRSLDINGKLLMNQINKMKNQTQNLNPRLVRKLISTISEKFTDGDRFMPSREEAKNFYAQFIGDNEELRRQALPHRTTPIFNTDFSDYPEIENNKSKRADIDYIVEILLQELLLNKTHRQ
jgi:hypothetical protein